MITYPLTQRQFRRLEEYELNLEVINTESILYIIKKNNSKHLLKRFFITEGEYFANKLYTLSLLIDKGESFGIDRLVLPESICTVDDTIVGSIMPFIENNTNMGNVLQSFKFSNEQKIKYLKEIGKMIEKIIHKHRETGFLLGDVHEYNFILNHDDNKVYAVDLDGCKVGNNKVMGVKYCDCNRNTRSLPKKYPVKDGYTKPTINSELLCYSHIVLNTIARIQTERLSIDEFYLYLQYLIDVGFNKEFIDIFANLYTGKDNYFPLELLDTIPKDFGIAGYKVYEHVRKK